MLIWLLGCRECSVVLGEDWTGLGGLGTSVIRAVDFVSCEYFWDGYFLHTFGMEFVVSFGIHT